MFDHIPNLIERYRNFTGELERQMSAARIAKCRPADFRDACPIDCRHRSTSSFGHNENQQPCRFL